MEFQPIGEDGGLTNQFERNPGDGGGAVVVQSLHLVGDAVVVAVSAGKEVDAGDFSLEKDGMIAPSMSAKAGFGHQLTLPGCVANNLG